MNKQWWKERVIAKWRGKQDEKRKANWGQGTWTTDIKKPKTSKTTDLRKIKVDSSLNDDMFALEENKTS